MKHALISPILLAVALSAISCSAASPSQSEHEPAFSAMPPTAAPAPTSAPAATGIAPGQPLPSSGEAQNKSADSSSVPAGASAERMIVYNMNVSLEVQDTDKAVNDITAIAAQYKGYVSASNLSRDPQSQLQGSITLRIPAESLDAAEKQIEAAGLKVLSRNKNSNDVTDQYTDLNSRLTNLQATRDDLRKMLDSVTEKSNRAEDILAIYNQLSTVQGEIEQIQGQMNVLNKTTTLATITVNLVPHVEVQIVEPETWLPNRTAAQALRSLVQAFQGLINLTIWVLLFFLPVIIVLLLPLAVLAIILRLIWRRRGKKVPQTA